MISIKIIQTTITVIDRYITYYLFLLLLLYVPTIISSRFNIIQITIVTYKNIYIISINTLSTNIYIYIHPAFCWEFMTFPHQGQPALPGLCHDGPIAFQVRFHGRLNETPSMDPWPDMAWKSEKNKQFHPFSYVFLWVFQRISHYTKHGTLW